MVEKTIDIILDREIDSQEILDIMLTFVETTIQKKNSGGNCLNKNITMRELIAVVKILSCFQLTQFEEDLLVNIIRHKIETSNCLYSWYESYMKLQESGMQETCKYWYPLFSIMIDYWSFNLRYLLKYQKQAILDLKEISNQIIEVMINKTLLFYFPDPFYDNSDILEFLMEIRDLDSIFELYKYEKQKWLTMENSKLEEDHGIEWSFTWKIGKIKGNYYKETEPFLAEEWYWAISFAYVKGEEESVNVSIRMWSNPFEERKKAYFK